MGIYDTLRNQTVKVRTAGNSDAAKALIPRAKKVIEKIQGSLDLGINEQMNKTQRILLDDYAYLDVNISAGVTSPIITATITANVERAAQVGEEIKTIVVNRCPGLPLGEPGRRLFTQLMGDTEELSEEIWSFQRIPEDKYSSGTAEFDNEIGQSSWYNWKRVDLKGSPIRYRGDVYDNVGIDASGNVNFDLGNRWADLGYATDGPCILGGGYLCDTWIAQCDAHNYIAQNAFVGSDAGVMTVPQEELFRYRILAGLGIDPYGVAVRAGEAVQPTGEQDQDGNYVFVLRKAVIFQNIGIPNVYPDSELVFLEPDAMLGCPRAIGVFYNAFDGTPLREAYPGNNSFVMDDGLDGWCSVAATTSDTYDINWFCENAASICPSLTNGVGSFPVLTTLKFVGANNQPYAYATPVFQSDLGYAALAYAGRTFWFLQDGQGHIQQALLQDWITGQLASEDDFLILPQ
jgi:hypothetical protein